MYLNNLKITHIHTYIIYIYTYIYISSQNKLTCINQLLILENRRNIINEFRYGFVKESTISKIACHSPAVAFQMYQGSNTKRNKTKRK